MQTVRYLITALLIMAVVPAGIPLHLQEDVSLDGDIALNDAVLLVRTLSTTEETHKGFANDFSRMITTLQMVAGIKTDPSDSNDGQSAPVKKSTSLQPDLAGLLTATINIPTPDTQASAYSDYNESFYTLITSPPCPPPKIVS